MILFYAYIVYSLQDIFSLTHVRLHSLRKRSLKKNFFEWFVSSPPIVDGRENDRVTQTGENKKKERKKRIAIATSRFNDPIYTQYVHQVLQSLRTCWAIDFQWSAVTVADIIIFKHSRAYRGACDPGSWVRSYIHPPRVPSLFLRTLPSHTWNSKKKKQKNKRMIKALVYTQWDGIY